MTRDTALALITTYGKAWETRDPELIVTIFTEDATYHDPKEPLNVGRSAIHDYWVTKVIGEQENIVFSLLHVWVDGDAVIAEWHAEFDDIPRQLHVSLREVAIFTVAGDKFSALREYYKSEKTPIV